MDGKWLNPRTLVLYFTLMAGVISLIGIGNNQYWDDEASTAVIGRNFINTGSLSAWDGRNLLSYGMSGSVNEDMKKVAPPPLQYIVAGISLSIFGNSTGGGRFLFLLIGLFGIPLVALWYRREFNSEHYWVPALALALNVAYLLYIRQVRYYPLGITFAFGALWAWASIRHSRNNRQLGIWISVCLGFCGLLVLSQYLYAAAMAGVVFISLLRPHYRNRNNLILFGVLCALGLLALLLLSVYSPGTLSNAFAWESSRGNRFDRLVRALWMVPRDAARFEFFPYGIALFWGAAVLLLKKSSTDLSKQLGWVLLYCFAIVFAISLFSPQPILRAEDTDMRYYTMLIPMGAIAAALVFELLRGAKYRWLPWAFMAVLLSSNLLNLNFLGKIGWHSRIVQHLGENLSDFTISSEAIGEYMLKNIDKDKCIFMVPMYSNIIQMFYHPEYKFCGLVSKSAGFAKKHGHKMRPDLFFENAIPDYFFVERRNYRRFGKLLEHMYGPGTYTLDTVLPVHWKIATRPEIPWRRFGPLPVKQPKFEGVLVYGRTMTPAHPPRINHKQAEQLLMY